MSDRKILIDHDGRQFTGEVMSVRSTRLGYNDHGVFTAVLNLDGSSNSAVSLSDYVLDTPIRDGGKFLGRGATAYGMDHILRVMKTVGVSNWEDLVGEKLLVLHEGPGGWGSRPVGIAHLTDENKIFIYQDHADAWREKVA